MLHRAFGWKGGHRVAVAHPFLDNPLEHPLLGGDWERPSVEEASPFRVLDAEAVDTLLVVACEGLVPVALHMLLAVGFDILLACEDLAHAGALDMLPAVDVDILREDSY